MPKTDDFQPDWASAPGETIADILEERQVPTSKFARQIERSVSETDRLLHGELAITRELAQKLENVLGGSATFWMTRESQYREDITRLGPIQRAHTAWLDELPVSDMIKFGWIKPTSSSVESRQRACLEFFGAPDVPAWQRTYSRSTQMAAFRTSPTFASHPGAVVVWLRQGELEAESIKCAPWNPAKFQSALSKLRSLTWKKNPNLFLVSLQKLCADCGVAVVILRAPTGCRASGATRFLTPTKALLLLSFRYLSDDHFWFTFFHEAGHLLLHGKDALFLEGAGLVSTRQEQEANDFAALTLVPTEYQSEMRELPANGRAVLKFAKKIGVAPGIIVGQLQHLGLLGRNQLNLVKRRFRWVDS
jgi:plasmid maintenance system antidote protein VapI